MRRHGASEKMLSAIAAKCSAAAIANSSLLRKWWKKPPLVSPAASQMSSTRVAEYPFVRMTRSEALRMRILDSTLISAICMHDRPVGIKLPSNWYAVKRLFPQALGRRHRVHDRKPYFALTHDRVPALARKQSDLDAHVCALAQKIVSC